jgi:hypothetical protein
MHTVLHAHLRLTVPHIMPCVVLDNFLAALMLARLHG